MGSAAHRITLWRFSLKLNVGPVKEGLSALANARAPLAVVCGIASFAVKIEVRLRGQSAV
jgi:hypothetical protein